MRIDACTYMSVMLCIHMPFYRGIRRDVVLFKLLHTLATTPTTNLFEGNQNQNPKLP